MRIAVCHNRANGAGCRPWKLRLQGESKGWEAIVNMRRHLGRLSEPNLAHGTLGEPASPCVIKRTMDDGSRRVREPPLINGEISGGVGIRALGLACRHQTEVSGGHGDTVAARQQTAESGGRGGFNPAVIKRRFAAKMF
jgi:hypothetical protein